MNAFIYALICPISKDIRYVGQTIVSLNKRKNNHLSEYRRFKKNGTGYTHKFNWLSILDKENLLNKLEIQLLEECDRSLVDERESYWLEFYKTPKLTNTLPGGTSYSPDKGRRISYSKLGDKNPMFGKTLSDEHKAKMVEGGKVYRLKNGNVLSKETKEKISKSQSTCVSVLDENFSVILEFSSVKSCAMYFGRTPETIQQALSRYRPTGRWLKKIYWIVKTESVEEGISQIKSKPENQYLIENKRYPLTGRVKIQTEASRCIQSPLDVYCNGRKRIIKN